MNDETNNPTDDDVDGHNRHFAMDAPPAPDADDTEGHTRFKATEAPSSPDSNDDDVAGHVQPNRLRDRDS